MSNPVPQPVVSCVQTSSTTTLHCSAKGHPLQYRWSGPGLEGATWSPMYNVTVITTAEPGNYRCEVKNAVSEKRQDFNTKDCGSAGKGSEDPEQPSYHKIKTSIPSFSPPSHGAAALQTPDRNKDGQAAIVHSPPTGEHKSQPLLPELGLSQSNDELEYKKSVKDRVSIIEEAGGEGKLVSPRKYKNEGMMKWEKGMKDTTRDSLVSPESRVPSPAKPTQALTTEKRSSTDHNVKQADKEKGEEREKTDEGKKERKEKTDKGGGAEEEGMSKQGKEKDNEKKGEQASEGKKEEEEKGQEKDRTESHRVKTSRMKTGIEGNAFLENCQNREKEDEKEEEGRKDEKAEGNVCSSPTKKIPATKQGGMEQDESKPLLQESESNNKPESKGFVKSSSVKHRVKEIEEGKLVSPRKDQNEGMTQQMCQDSPVGSPPAKPPRALTTEKRSSTDHNVKQADERGEEREKTDEGKEETTEKTEKGGDTQEEGMSKEGKEKDDEKEGEDERENRQNGEKEEEGRKDEKDEGKEEGEKEKGKNKENKEDKGKEEDEKEKGKSDKKEAGKDEGKEEDKIPKPPPADISSAPTDTLILFLFLPGVQDRSFQSPPKIF
uniref:uncharacterized protein n=1 Tax=Centroberyx gerrardi TaxID=166262 RepID=UPI003AAA7482